MAHAAKFAANAVGRMCGHYGRTEGDGVRRSNENIDPARTHLNYNLAPEHDGGQIAFMQKRLSEVKLQKRADVNVLCDWVVTLPVDEKFKRFNPEIQRIETIKFFRASYDFLERRYGRENVVSAYVHMDEKTPHLHFAFIPVTEDKKKGGFKVSAKEVLSRSDLRTFHTDLQKALRERGVILDVLNGATKDGNKTVAELKKESIRAEVQTVERQGMERVRAVRAEVERVEQEAAAARLEAEEARVHADKVQGDIKSLEGQKEGLQGEIAALQGEREKLLTTAEVEALKGTRTLTGGLKGVTYKEYEALQRTAAEVDSMRVRLSGAEERAAAVESREKAVLDSYNRQLQEKSAELNAQYQKLIEPHKQRTLAEMQKQVEIDKKLSRLEQLERFLDAHFPRWRELFQKFQTAERARGQDKGRDR
ncbi:MobV family relaxase [uncultured Alistipes sp.]|uniref:MobV family relaxase n=1 Tax=uncultured Alistipes sp. TaxID=538949 RepID=UPI00321FDF3A